MSAASQEVCIVTGGAGFIGSHMVDFLLAQGYEVRAIDNLVGGRLSNVEHHKNNSSFTLDERDIRLLKPDDSLFQDVKYVFHFAGIGDIVPSIERPLEYMSTNVQGTVHVLEAARHHGAKKVVYAASSSCYGLAKELPTTETAPIQPEYPYALSKYQGEQAVFHWGKVYKLPVCSIRMFNVYGPRSRTTGAYGAVFGVFLAQKLANQPLTIVGDGSQTRDFVFVTDVARAFYQVAASHHSNEVYNLGANKPQSVAYLAELLGGEREFIPKRPGEPDCTWADIKKITDHVGWQPKVSFEEGVQEMLKNISYWKDAPVWDKQKIQQATATWFNYLDS